MDLNKINARKLKKELIKIWESDDFESKINEYIEIIPQKLLSPMFSALCNSNETVKWNSVRTFNLLSKHYMSKDKTKSREMARRCMWMLGEESGNIPWGISEALAATVVANKLFVEEYAEICLSYIYESDEFDTNYLDHPPLRVGAYWGVCRILEEFPEAYRGNVDILIKQSNEEVDPNILAYLYHIFKNAKSEVPESLIAKLKDSSEQVNIHINGKYLLTDLRSIIN